MLHDYVCPCRNLSPLSLKTKCQKSESTATSRSLNMMQTLCACRAVEKGGQALHASCCSCSARVHGPHAPGSASRQRLGDTHQVAPGEARPRSLTWETGMAGFSK